MAQCIGCGYTERDGEEVLVEVPVNNATVVYACDDFCVQTAQFDGRLPSPEAVGSPHAAESCL